MTAKMRKLMPVLVGAMTMALVIASCGGDDDTPTSVPAGATATAAPTSTSAPTGPSGSLTTAQATIGNESYIPRMMGPTERLIANLTYDPAMGIDRDDTIIRRRLRQKLEFLTDDVCSIVEPTDEELAAYLNDNQ
ncbi:MAG: hypothetical protein O7F09_06850, partial [Chloroflexi bacterium]|nr:hypothetical protein [Chloroflexota bacterium]